MPAERIRDVIGPWFEEAFARAVLDERLTYELGFGVMQTPHGAVAMMTIYAHIPSATIGDVHWAVGQLPAVGLTQEIVDREIRAFVDALFQKRTEALSVSNGNKGAISMPWTPPDGGIRPTGP